MSNNRSPQHILNAFNRLENEMPALVGTKNWSAIQDEYQTNIQTFRKSDDPNQQAIVAFQLIQLIAPYGTAQKRLDFEIEMQARIKEVIQLELQPLVSQINSEENVIDITLDALQYTTSWSVSPEDMSDLSQDREKLIKLHEGGLDGGKTIKLKNLEFDFEGMPQLVAGTLLTSYNIIDKPNPLLIAAGVLMTIAAVVKAMTEELSEQETSVFWGMIEACGNEYAPESEILKATNKARADYGMEALDERELLNSLKKLERVACIEQKQKDAITHWGIIEKYKIKN